MDELCVVVKKANRIPSLLLPLVIFDENLWLILFFAGISIGIVWSFLRCINNLMKRPSDPVDKVKFYVDSYNQSRFLAQQSQVRQYLQIFVDTWLLFLSIPVRKFTRMQNERIFITSVCLISMVFVSMYQSGLATIFVRPLYFKDINSLHQLDKSGLQIIVKYPGFLTDVFSNDSSEIFRSLRKKMKLIKTNVNAMNLVKNLHSPDIATITRRSSVQLDNSEFFIRKELHIIDKECPKKYFLAYMVPVHSFYLEKVNEILFDIQRYGFIMKWIDDIKFYTNLINRKKIEVEISAAKVLSLDDLKFPFLVLTGGNSLGVFAFALEFAAGFVKRRRNFKKYFV